MLCIIILYLDVTLPCTSESEADDACQVVLSPFDLDGEGTARVAGASILVVAGGTKLDTLVKTDRFGVRRTAFSKVHHGDLTKKENYLTTVKIEVLVKN